MFFNVTKLRQKQHRDYPFTNFVHLSVHICIKRSKETVWSPSSLPAEFVCVFLRGRGCHNEWMCCRSLLQYSGLRCFSLTASVCCCKRPPSTSLASFRTAVTEGDVYIWLLHQQCSSTSSSHPITISFKISH